MLILNTQLGNLKAGSWFLPSIAMLLSLIPCLNECLAQEARDVSTRQPRDWGREVRARVRCRCRNSLQRLTGAGQKSVRPGIFLLEQKYRKVDKRRPKGTTLGMTSKSVCLRLTQVRGVNE